MTVPSRLFQIASHLSYTLRISLIFHEVRSRIGTSLPVAIGAPIPFAAIAGIKDRQALADDLCNRVYGLARHAPAGVEHAKVAGQYQQAPHACRHGEQASFPS